jgi:hypothetical protein
MQAIASASQRIHSAHHVSMIGRILPDEEQVFERVFLAVTA